MTWRIFHVFYFPTRKPIFSICLLVLFIIKFPRWFTCVLFSKNIHFTLSAFLRFYCLQTNLLQRDSTLNFSSTSLFFLSSYLARNFNFISQKILFENRTQIQKKGWCCHQQNKMEGNFRTLQHILHEISNFPPYDPSLLLW